MSGYGSEWCWPRFTAGRDLTLRLWTLGVLAVAMTSLGLLTSGTAYARDTRPSWVAAWGLPVNASDNTAFADQTIRDVVRASFGGNRVRIRLSNAFGTQPVTLQDGHIGISAAGAAVEPGNNVPLTFDGSPTVTIPAGGSVLSDPASLHVQALDHVTVSVFAPTSTGPGTGDGELSTYYTAPGDHTADSNGTAFGAAVPGAFFVTDVDVYAPNDGLIVGFGDSITVGYNASDEGWPYWLANRLVELAREGGPRLSIIDMGISGNQVTQNTAAGQAAENRLQRDVLDQTGLRGVLMMEGINDIGNFGQPASVPEGNIEAGLADIVQRVRAVGAGILLSPLTPSGDAAFPAPYGPLYSAPASIQERFDVNDWIRRQSRAYSPLLDFEPVIENPQDPNEILAAYDSGDDLHPNIAGQQAMADSIPFQTIERLVQPRHHQAGIRPHRRRIKASDRHSR
jgi:lysophospholipase L1-like esterase